MFQKVKVMNVELVILFHIVLTQTETRVLENRPLSRNRRFPEADWRVLNSSEQQFQILKQNLASGPVSLWSLTTQKRQ